MTPIHRGNIHPAYLGGLEKIYRKKANETTDLIEYKVTVGNVVITERTNAVNNACTAEAYLHKDHLGSPLTITNEHGTVIQQNVYDPWGKSASVVFGWRCDGWQFAIFAILDQLLVFTVVSIQP